MPCFLLMFAVNSSELKPIKRKICAYILNLIFVISIVQYKICAHKLYLTVLNELFNIKEREATHVLCTQPVSAIIEVNIFPILRIIILILSLYLIFVKERTRPEIIL